MLKLIVGKMKKKIGLMYFLTGIGHYRAAYSVGIYFEEKGFDVVYIDPIKVVQNNPTIFLKLLKKVYDVLIRIALNCMIGPNVLLDPEKNHFYSRWLVGFGVWLETIFGKYLAKSLKKYFKFESYDFIISFHPIATNIVYANLKDSGKQSKLINVCLDEVTDLIAYFYKFFGVVNTANSEKVAQSMVRAGLDSEQIKVVGYPLDPNLYRNRSILYKRIQNDLSNKKLVIGIYLGLIAPEEQLSEILLVLKELKDIIISGKIEVEVLSCNHPEFEKQVCEIFETSQLGKNIKTVFMSDPRDLIAKGHEMMLNKINVM